MALALVFGALAQLAQSAQSEDVQLLQKQVHKVTQLTPDLSHQEAFADATLYQALFYKVLCNSICCLSEEVMSSCSGPITKTCWDKKFDGRSSKLQSNGRLRDKVRKPPIID